MRISICNFSKLKALCKIFEKTLHDERPFRVVNGLDRDQSRLISRTPAILLWKLSQESLDNISLISRLNQQVEWGYKRNKKERRCWYCSKITPIFCPGNGPSCPYWYDLPILFNSMQKIPSEMEVAPHYNCWHCWHCSTLLTWRIMSNHFIHICLVPIFQ